MRTLFISLLTVLFACTVLGQDTEGKYTLSNGHLQMVIDAERGAKILSLKYDDQEVISQSRWPESFGSTFWTSPQKEWNWPPVPEIDKQAYSVEKDGKVLRMTSGVSDRLKYRIRKEFSVDEEDGAFVITYSIINESNETRRVAPWEITRVKNEGGLIFFEAPADSIWPAGLMNFTNAQGAAWYVADEAQQNRKVNADGKGWLAYLANGLLLVKRFEDLDATQPAPGEAEVQVYVNRGKTYIELENQGPYSTLQPQQQLSWTVRWFLLPYDGSPTPSEALLKLCRNVIVEK